MSRLSRFIEIVCDIADDDSHGYDQTKRWGPDFDCTSLCYYAAHHAGYDVGVGSGYSGTLRRDFENAGWTAVEYETIYGNPVGSIMLREGYHAEVVIGENRWAGAHLNEQGKITGGMTGDQTGKEICRCNPYPYGTYPNDWDWVMVPPEYSDDYEEDEAESEDQDEPDVEELGVHYTAETEDGFQPVCDDGAVCGDGTPIIFFSIWCPQYGRIKAQAYTVDSGWLPELTDPDNVMDRDQGAVGDGSPITKLRLYLDSYDGEWSVMYRVYVGGKASRWYNYLEDNFEIDDDGNPIPGGDDFAGDGVNPIEHIQAYIIPASY